jgi:hypothetical protein
MSKLKRNKTIKDKALNFVIKNKNGGKIMKQAVFTKSLTISMPPEQYEQIKEITDQCRISMGEWVRDAVDAALKTNQQKEDTI